MEPASQVSYFAALELPEQRSIDRKDPEARFYRLSRERKMSHIQRNG